jgi:hypothetical protein
MAKGDHTFRRKIKGATGGGYRRPRVQIGFEKMQMTEITRLAKENNRSFAAQVRALLDEAIYLTMRR